jgi:hypothetical protein
MAFLLEQQQHDTTMVVSLEQNMQVTRATLRTACRDIATLQQELSVRSSASRMVWGKGGSSSAAQEQFLHDLELAAAAVRVILLDRTLSSNHHNHKHLHVVGLLPKHRESLMQTIRSTLPNLLLFTEEEEQIYAPEASYSMMGMSVESRWNQKMKRGDDHTNNDEEALHIALRQWEQTDSSHKRRSRNLLLTRIAWGIASTLLVVLAGASSTQ